MNSGSNSKFVSLTLLCALLAGTAFLVSHLLKSGASNSESKNAPVPKLAIADDSTKSTQKKIIPVTPKTPQPLSQTKAPLALKSLAEFSGAILKALTDKAKPDEIAHILNSSALTLSPAEHSQLLQTAISAMVENGYTSSADVLRQLTRLHDQQIMAAGIPNALATKDPKGAMVWAASLEGHDMGRTAHQTVGRAVAESNREAVIDWLNSTNNPLLQASIAEGLAQSWSQKDMQSLIDWATKIEDPLVQTAVLVKAVKVLSATEPDVSAQWAIKFPPGLARRQAVAFAATSWGEANPEAAAAWALSLQPNTPGRDDAIVGVGTGWAKKNIKQAKAWSLQFPSGIQAQMFPPTAE